MQTNHILKLLTTKTTYKLLICAALLPLADFLFYGQHAGWTLGLFGVSLLLAVLGCNQTIAHRRVDIASLKRRQALGALEYVGQQEAMENTLKAEGFDISPDPQMLQRRLIKGYKMLKNEKNSSAPDTVLSPREEDME